MLDAMDRLIASSLHQLRVMESLVHSHSRWEIGLGDERFPATVDLSQGLAVKATIEVSSDMTVAPVLLRDGDPVLYHPPVEIGSEVREFAWRFNLTPTPVKV